MRTLRSGQFISKRSIFYQDVTLFENQSIVNDTIEEIARSLEVSRGSLRVIACSRAFVAGPLQWADESGCATDCSQKIQMIPSHVDTIKIQKTSAVAILIVEKETVFMRLVQSTIVKEVILITGRGVPDYSTRLFLKLLEDTFELPITGLFDMDPYGFLIMSIYKFGSRSASYDGMNMACSSMTWLGLRPSEMSLVRKRNLLELNDKDRALIDRMLKEKHLPEQYRTELEIMRQNNVKAELEALTGDGMELTELYLPDKFCRHDWI
jgi:meiotic recombination protein SPO11